MSRKPNGLISAALYSARLMDEIWKTHFDTSSTNDEEQLRDAIDRAFRAGVKEGRRRQLHEMRRHVECELDATHTHECPVGCSNECSACA